MGNATAAGGVVDGVEPVLEQVVEWRRHLHRHPELSFQERETAAFIAETLEGFGAALEVRRPAENSVIARLDTGRPGPVVALRADIDALPIVEQSGVDFASENPGVMHACGHDGHTAMLLGAARLLAGARDRLPGGEVRFLFQPAEEIDAGRRARPRGGGRRRGGRPDLRLPPVDAARVRQGRRDARPVHGRRRLLHARDHGTGRARRAPAHRRRHDRDRRPGGHQPAAHRRAPHGPARARRGEHRRLPRRRRAERDPRPRRARRHRAHVRPRAARTDAAADRGRRARHHLGARRRVRARLRAWATRRSSTTSA